MRKSIFVKKWRNISTGLLSIIFLLNFFSGSNQWLASVTCFFFSYKSSLISSPLRARQAVQLWWPSPLHKVTYFSETCYSLHLFWAPVVTRSDLSRFGWSCPLRDVACAWMSREDFLSRNQSFAFQSSYHQQPPGRHSLTPLSTPLVS